MSCFNNNDKALLLRTDFSCDEKWKKCVHIIRQPGEDFFCNMDFIDDVIFSGKNHQEILGQIPNEYLYPVIFIADKITFLSDDFPCLVLGINQYNRGLSFRAAACVLASVENNLGIANMDFEDFADAVESDGVFRGFPRPSNEVD